MYKSALVIFSAWALLTTGKAGASKWTGPQFVVALVKVTAIKPCPQSDVRLDATEWIIERGADCVMIEARPQKVLELISAWNKNPDPFLQGSYYFAAKKGALVKGSTTRVLLRPGPRYDGKLEIVGQKIETRIVEADTQFWHSEINVLSAQGADRVRMELRVAQRQIGRLVANPVHAYSLLLDLKKSCVSAEAAKHIDIKDCVSYADFRHSSRARIFQTNRVSGTIEIPNLRFENGFGTFRGAIDLTAEGNPAFENSVGKEAVRFYVRDNGDFEELPAKP